MIPEFDTANDETAVLLCPACGGNNLHHATVEIFCKRSESAEEGWHLTTSEFSATLDTSLDKNPSRDRDGLLVHFWCENCSAKPTLSLAQHKGWTLLSISS